MKKMKKLISWVLVLMLLMGVSSFAKKPMREKPEQTEETVATENTENTEETEEIKEQAKEKEEKKHHKKEQKPGKTFEKTENIEDEVETPEEEKSEVKKEKPEKPEHNKKFTKEELEVKKEAYKNKKKEAKDYIREMKEGFHRADKDTRKEILSEIGKVKKELHDDSVGVFARGKAIDFEKFGGVEPKIEMGRTMIPLRAIVEALGATVTWDEETQTVIIQKGEDIVILNIGKNEVTVNGEVIQSEVAPKIEKNRTMVPLRLVAEALKEKVDWDEDSKTVIIEEETAEEAEKEEVQENTEEAPAE